MFSAIGELCQNLVIFKKLKISCCNKADDSKSQIEQSSDFISKFYNFDRDFILAKYDLISDFYDEDDIGKFFVDIDGFCIYINDKIPEMFGEKKRRIKYNLIYSYNIFRDDMSNVINIWEDALKNKKSIIYKERRIISSKIIYLIFEVYPIFSKNGCLGMKGIIIRVTKQVWNKFDPKEAMKGLLFINDEKEMPSGSIYPVPFHQLERF